MMDGRDSSATLGMTWVVMGGWDGMGWDDRGRDGATTRVAPIGWGRAGSWGGGRRRWGLAADAFVAGGGVGAFVAGLELVVGAGVQVLTVVEAEEVVCLDAAGYGVAEIPAIGAGVGGDAGLQVIAPVVQPSLASTASGVDPESERVVRVVLGG